MRSPKFTKISTQLFVIFAPLSVNLRPDTRIWNMDWIKHLKLEQNTIKSLSRVLRSAYCEVCVNFFRCLAAAFRLIKRFSYCFWVQGSGKVLSWFDLTTRDRGRMLYALVGIARVGSYRHLGIGPNFHRNRNFKCIPFQQRSMVQVIKSSTLLCGIYLQATILPAGKKDGRVIGICAILRIIKDNVTTGLKQVVAHASGCVYCFEWPFPICQAVRVKWKGYSLFIQS